MGIQKAKEKRNEEKKEKKKREGKVCRSSLRGPSLFVIARPKAAAIHILIVHGLLHCVRSEDGK